MQAAVLLEDALEPGDSIDEIVESYPISVSHHLTLQGGGKSFEISKGSCLELMYYLFGTKFGWQVVMKVSKASSNVYNNSCSFQTSLCIVIIGGEHLWL